MLVWSQLNTEEQAACLSRPALAASGDLQQQVSELLALVKRDGDSALKRLNKQFDNADFETLLVSDAEYLEADNMLSQTLKTALETAFNNITRFHEAQQPTPIKVTTQPGVVCELRYQAIDAVGIYVPGGSAPLPSSVLMQGALAKLAGASTIVLATPCKNGEPVNPAILYAAKLCGVTHLVKVGGAQAIAAMAFGTESVPQVNKIFGPGNSYVTMAKQLVAQQVTGLAIDMPAGPSELRNNTDFGRR